MSLRIDEITDMFVSPLNGFSPVAISYSTTPSEKMSERVIDRLALGLLGRHVGDRADDASLAGEVAGRHAVTSSASPSSCASRSLARPKSSTFTRPSGVTMTLAGFRSRWVMPALVRGADRVG